MIKHIFVDVDGTLTDGGIYYDETGNELKKFCTKDAAGILLAKAADIEIIVLTGRKCRATKRRIKELGVESLYQNVKNKAEWIRDWKKKEGISKEDIGYIGDDLNDIESMRQCGFVGCPADACLEVKEISNYVSVLKGGMGAVRDVIEYYLKEKNRWQDLVREVYGESE